MNFTNQEADYLVGLLTNQALTLLSRVTRWQTHSLSQQQYDQQVSETLQPELELFEQLTPKLTPAITDTTQLGALKIGIQKLQAATTYQLTTVQLAQANERRLNRRYRN